jgi:hypothetical protein
MSVHDSGWPTSLIFCENDHHFTISLCYLFDIYVVYVLCRVRPNTRDEVKDETCKDMPVTGPTSALLISNRHIQTTSIVESPSRLTPSPIYQLRACFVNYVPLLWMTTTWFFGALCSKCMICELCGLCEVCW